MKKILFLIVSIMFIGLNCTFAKQNIHVAYTIDNNYPIFTLISINSAILNNTSNSDLHFHIIENNLTDKNKQMMKKFVEERNHHIEFIHIDMSTIDDNNDYYANIPRITRIAMARIVMPNLLPTLDRVIYLDADTLVNTDLLKLYNYNLKKYPVGMCCDFTTGTAYTEKYAHYILNREITSCNILSFESRDNYNTLYSFENGYYNSGVILMDLKKWRKLHISEKMLKFLNNNRGYFAKRKNKHDTKVLFGDQDLINIVLENQVKIMPQRWNNQMVIDSGTVKPAKSIIHYIGTPKPWDTLYMNDATKLYYKYWWNTPLIKYWPLYALNTYKLNYKYMVGIKVLRCKELLSELIMICFPKHSVYLISKIYAETE